MTWCPFAEHPPYHFLDGQPYTGGPFRIVLHTTECSTADGAMHELFTRGVPSHFVVDAHHIFQLLDTNTSAKALRNSAGGVETNRLSAIQIEMVGFAGKPKAHSMLANVAKLCRWIEADKSVPQAWPNGMCVPAINGKDSNHHNRDAHTWATKGGYYGHEHVPENIHWDPALTMDETLIITPNIGT